MNSFLYLSDSVGRFFVHDSHPDDFATRFLETPDLMDSFSDVPRIGLRHGLDGDWGIPPNLNRSDRNLTRLSSFHQSITPLRHQSPSTKSQTISRFQFRMTKTLVSDFGHLVIEVYLEFRIWNLKFQTPVWCRLCRVRKLGTLFPRS